MTTEKLTPLTPEQRTLVENNTSLARSLAMSVWVRNRVELEGAEIVAVAFQGLVTAARRYDPRLSTPETVANGRAFAGFARIYINGSILEWQRSRDHVPKRQRKVYRELQQHGWGEGKTIKELALITGMDPNKVSEIIHSVETTAISLDESDDDWEDSSQSIGVYSRYDVEGAILQTSVQDAYYRKFDSLADQYQIIFVLRHFEGWEFSTIATELELRQNYVRQVYQEVVLDLHDAVVREAS